MNLLTIIHINDGLISLLHPGRKQRLKTFLTFLKLGFKSVIFKKTKSEKFFGYDVRVFDYRSFAMVFLEIFMKNDYYIDLKKKYPVIIDCGGNIGMSVLFFKYHYPESKIHVFEPFPENYQILHSNIVRNGLTEVYGHKKAVGDSDGKVEFFYSDPNNNTNSLGGSLVHTAGFGDQKIMVDKIRLGDFFDEFEEIDLLKMDVEGAEWDTMIDLCKTGKIKKVKNFVCEYHYDSDDMSKPVDEFLRLIRENGFTYDVYMNKGVANIIKAYRE